jgi:alanine racemase
MNLAPDQESVRISGPSEAEAGGLLTVDLSALVENWRMLVRRTTPAECAAVVKADAYGCGLGPVAMALVAAGCRTFFVAHLAEARDLRTVAPDAAVYVLNGFMPGMAAAFARTNARPVMGSLGELAEWDAFIKATGWTGGAALQVDTGMNRLGIDPTEAIAVAAKVAREGHGLTLLMSHFACADTPNHPMNERQISLFRELRLAFRGIPASLANSAGIFLGSATHCDLVRPGIALYGGNPVPGRENPMRAVVELKGRVAQVRNVNKGETVGYGATWTARHPTKLAVVAVGYGDGYQRAASGSDKKRGGEVVIAGKLCPIVGRVSMDLLTVDIGDIAEHTVRRGDPVTLIGGPIGVDQLAAYTGTISYEVLTNLGRRYYRSYIEG